MGYFPTVNKGDKVKLSAEFHNAVVRTVNAVLAASKGRGGALARTRTTIPVLASEAIPGGHPVELVGESDFSWNTRPYTVKKATSTDSVFGILREGLNQNEVGSVVVSGLALIEMPDNSTGDYVELKMDSGAVKFTRTSSKTPWPLLDVQTTSEGHQHGHIVWGTHSEPQNTNAFHASLVGFDSGEKTYTIEWLGGSAQIYPAVDYQLIPAGSIDNLDESTVAYLLYDPEADPKWEFRLSHADGDIPSNPQNGEIAIPLWHFTYANDGTGILTQDFEGGVMVPKLRNALDTESAS